MTNVDISILSPSDESAWQAYVNAHPDATIYHTLEWRDILYNEYGFEPVYLIAKSGGKVIGVLPMFLAKNLRGKRLVSLPFSIYGGPVGDSGEIVSALLSKAKELVMGGMAGSIEIRCNPYSPDLPSPLAGEGQGEGEFSEQKGMKVDLTPGIDVLWKQLTDRNDVNRAIKEGLKFSLSDGDGIEKFYQLQLMTRKRLGLPTPSLKYYSSFFEKMSGMVKLALVEKGGIPIAGGFFFIHKNTVLYALGASDYRYLSSRPNDLLIWEMIKWAEGAGFKRFDLGPTPSSDSGLLHFKRKWGGRETETVRYYYPNAPQESDTTRGSPFFSVLPTGLSGRIGHYAIRYLG